MSWSNFSRIPGIAFVVVGIAVPTMMQVGPSQAETNFCHWFPGSTDQCLHGLSPDFLKISSGIFVIIGLLWLFWPMIVARLNKRTSRQKRRGETDPRKMKYGPEYDGEENDTIMRENPSVGLLHTGAGTAKGVRIFGYDIGIAFAGSRESRLENAEASAFEHLPPRRLYSAEAQNRLLSVLERLSEALDRVSRAAHVSQTAIFRYNKAEQYNNVEGLNEFGSAILLMEAFEKEISTINRENSLFKAELSRILIGVGGGELRNRLSVLDNVFGSIREIITAEPPKWLKHQTLSISALQMVEAAGDRFQVWIEECRSRIETTKEGLR